MFIKVLSKNAQNALALLGSSGILKNAYLAGGSALALQFGHRISVDFDFFTPQSFDPKPLEWDTVKKFFQTESLRLRKKYLEHE